ncbi:MAG: tRNA (adenosine(37)-N6)-threonylcarbamoyltransferase complex ATPase subunit type 1 TsaE [Eubacteriales bacterium]
MAAYITKSAEETEQVGASLGKTLIKGDVVAIFGEMGAGKTAFVRGLATGMGLSSCVSSPTFALVHEYQGELALYHFDMYRINSWDDLYSTGFFDYLYSAGVVVVEWSENIESALPENSIKVIISLGNTLNERKIVIMEDKNIENTCG